MEDVEPRFQHFLQPIRDLTKNWEVDVAAQLGEYLEELDQICISFDGGKTTMNFIEAALLIQGSACIYSKKVESLYSLVYQALDFISNKKREKQPTSLGQDGVDADVSVESQEEEFLSLDDIQDTSRANVDLRDDHRHSAVAIVPLTPMALVPPDEAEKKDNPLFSRKGEILASRKDFRMNTCTPHASGAFMLEMAGLSPTQCLPGRNCNWNRDNSVGMDRRGVPNLAPAAGSTPMEVSVCETPVLALNFSGEGGVADDACDDDNCDNLPPNVPNEDLDISMAGVEHVAHQMGAPQRKGYLLREKNPAQDGNAHVKDVLDLWRNLDPFSSSSEDKPLKKGKPFTVPPGLDDLPGTKRKRRQSNRLQEFAKWFSAMEYDGTSSQSNRKKGPSFADLEIMYWKNVKERLAAQRKLQKGMERPLLPQPFEEHASVEEEREDDCLDNMDDRGADDFLEHENIPPPEIAEDVPEGIMDPGEVPSSLSYEELVRKNVELFMAHSQKYARETVLSRRIRDWEEMMGPQLEEQEARLAFDIHSYGDRLVSSLGSLGKWHSFASLVAGQPAFDVCRCMLASLQLANDYTVEISQELGLEEAVDSMALRLLTQQRAHERFRSYTAPSVTLQ